MPDINSMLKERVEMRHQAIAGLILSLLFIGMLTLVLNTRQVKAGGTIYIRADGSVDPPVASISSVDNTTYTFTGNIHDSIVVERDNIVVDGISYILQGTWGGTGIDLSDRSNVIIKNVEIKAFYTAIYLSGSSNNSIKGNNVTNNRHGIDLHWSCNNTVSGNNVTNNYYGLWLYDSSYNSVYTNNITNNHYGIRLCFCAPRNKIYHNNIIRNWDQVYPRSSTNVWDDNYPSGGNHWSDYTGVDVKSGPNQDQPGSDGIGDTAYVIDGANQDNYPLMYPWDAPPPPSYALTIYSAPTGVTFTVDCVSCTTYWSGAYDEGAPVSLVMPEIHAVGDARYHWNQWSDGNTSQSRIVPIITNITLTAQYTGPSFELTVASSPMTGITFTINRASKTTPSTEWLLEGSHTIEMPETHNGYVWSHWLEDGDPKRIKTVTMSTNITLTAEYTEVPEPVGGKATPIDIPMNKPELLTPYIGLTMLLSVAVMTVVYVKKRKRELK